MNCVPGANSTRSFTDVVGLLPRAALFVDIHLALGVGDRVHLRIHGHHVLTQVQSLEGEDQDRLASMIASRNSSGLRTCAAT